MLLLLIIGGKIKTKMEVKQKAAANILLSEAMNDEEEKEKSSYKVRKWVGERERMGLFNMVKELAIEDTQAFMQMMRMRHKQFKEILHLIEPYIAW